MKMDRFLRTRLRMGILLTLFFVTYIMVFKAETDTLNKASHAADEVYHSQEKLELKKKKKLFYTSPNYPNIHGKPFDVDQKLLKELRLLTPDYVTLTPTTITQFVFATAASFAFFDMVKETVTSVQKYRPDDQIYVYDLGMSELQVHEIQSMCGVTYRKFGYSIYPRHVKKKFTYAWKPLIIADVLTRHSGVLWMDSSLRLTTGNFDVLLRQVQETGGALALTTTGHSTFAATHRDMYKYLPAGDPTALKREEQREATLLLYKTEPVMNQVVKWMVLCALDPHCIAPPQARNGCVWYSGDHFGQWGQCHRYDQSAFNILMLNYIKGQAAKGYYATSRVCVVQRYATPGIMPKYCGGDMSREDLEIAKE